MNLKAQFNAPILSASVGNVTIQGNVDVRPLSVTENGVYSESGAAYSPVTVNVKTGDNALTAILDGSATELRDLPSGLTKIKPYAFYQPTKKLPSEYEELDSVYFGGNSAIETDVASELNPKCYITAKLDGSRSSSQVLYGYDRGGNGGAYFGAMPNQTVWSLGAGINFTSALVETDIIIQQNVVSSSNFSISATIDGATKTRANSSSTGNFKVMIGGCVNSLGNVTYPIRGTVYGRIVFKAYGEVTQTYIPVRRVSDNAVGYYEIIGDKFVLPVGDALIGGAVIPIDETPSVISADLDVTEIGTYAFCNNTLSSLILRSPSVVAIADHALDGTSIASGAGTIYVPASLVSAYEAQYPGWAFDAIS